MAAGVYRPVDDALRIAVTELIHWIHSDYGLSELDAYELLSKVAKVHLTEMVDPNYVVIASIEKKYLPPKKGFAPRRSEEHTSELQSHSDLVCRLLLRPRSQSTLFPYTTLFRSLRIAVTELIHWIHSDYGLSELDAYELLSKVAKVHLTEMVDPNYVVIASIEKKYLPPKKGFAPR